VFGDVTFAQSPFASLGGKTLASTVSETSSVTETQSLLVVYGGFTVEAATAVSAEVSASNLLKALVAETASAEAAQTVITNMLAAQAETASAIDTPAFAPSTLNAAQAETATGLDSSSANAVLLGFVAEAVEAVDAYDRGLVFAMAVSESTTAQNTQTARVIFNGSVQELAQAAAEFSVIRTVSVNVTGVQLFVSIGDVLIWSVIDDSQNPNWQNINNVQGSGWTDIPS
jgi:hypothetical protein